MCRRPMLMLMLMLMLFAMHNLGTGHCPNRHLNHVEASNRRLRTAPYWNLGNL